METAIRCLAAGLIAGTTAAVAWTSLLLVWASRQLPRDADGGVLGSVGITASVPLSGFVVGFTLGAVLTFRRRNR